MSGLAGLAAIRPGAIGWGAIGSAAVGMTPSSQAPTGSATISPATPRLLPDAGPPPSNLPPAQAAKLWRAAQAFEGMTLGALLAPMFDTIHGAHGPFGGGNAEATWRPMLVSAIGKDIAAAGGLGLAVPVFHAMLAAQEARHPTPSQEPTP